MKRALYCLGGVVVLGGVLAAMGGSSTDAKTTDTAKAPAVEAANPSRAATCDKLLQKIDHEDAVWKSWHRNGDQVTVEVRSAYYRAEFDDKKTINGLVLCVAGEGRQLDDSISYVGYVDARTHKDVAHWSKYTGFGVEN